MSEKEKLEWIMRLIVTAGGPDQKPDEPDALFRLRLANWMLRVSVLYRTQNWGQTNSSRSDTL